MPFSTYTKAELHQLVADAGQPVVIKTAFIVNGKIDLESDFGVGVMYDGKNTYAQSMKDDLSNYDIVWTAFREQQPAPELNAASETSALTLKELNLQLVADAGQPIIVWVVLPGNESEPIEESWGMYDGDFLCTPDYTDGYDITNFSTEWIAYPQTALTKLREIVLVIIISGIGSRSAYPGLSQLFQNNLRHEPCSWSCAGSAENDLSPC